MDIKILFSARAWSALVPLLALLFGALGLPITEHMLTTTGQQIAALGVSALSFWSLAKQNPISAKGLGQLLQRRTWVAAIPVLMVVSQAFGRPVDEVSLTQFGDQVPLLVSAALAIVSKLRGDSAGTLAARAALR